jgi:hypothetical protein
MEVEPILWEVPHRRERPFPCFVGGCDKEAGHLTKFTYGCAIVQVCVCDECLKKPPESILNSFKWEREKVVN